MVDKPASENPNNPEAAPFAESLNEADIQAILDRRRQAQPSPLTPRPTLSPGFEAYVHSRKDYTGQAPNYQDPDQNQRPIGSPPSGQRPWPYPEGGTPSEQSAFPAPLPKPRLWQRQPYVAIAHILLSAGALTTAWLLGILIAQVLPGRFQQPPLQEQLLRKSGRLTSRLWHFPSLWDTPTTHSRIEAIPLPATGPISGPIELSPIERQPLIDELNAIETEVVTLDRRLTALENRLGSPPYQDVGIDSRIKTLRAAIDPPIRTDEAPAYEPVASEPRNRLLEVARLQISLPADALFAPGDAQLKQTALLEQVLDQLVNYPDATISVRSYSDDQASAKDSRDYTLAQAIALTNYLRRTLPTEHRWISVGLGQSQPVADNDDVINRQRNRRIEILVDIR